MTDITFTKLPGSAVWTCPEEPDVKIWMPCDRRAYEVQIRHGRDNWITLKGGFRKLERAQAFAAQTVKAGPAPACEKRYSLERLIAGEIGTMAAFLWRDTVQGVSYWGNRPKGYAKLAREDRAIIDNWLLQGKAQGG